MIQNDRHFSRILEELQIKCKNNQDFQNAILNYTKANNLVLPDNITYSAGIDFFDVRVNNIPVLIVCLPPVSNYEVEETVHTRRLLKSSHETTDVKYAIAV